MDPMTMAAIGGGAMNAGGSIAGAFMGAGGLNTGDLIMPTYDPMNDLGLSSSLFDALNQIGFGNIQNVPSPIQQLVNRINSLSIDEKTKRRALTALPKAIKKMPQGTKLSDVYRGGRLNTALKKMGLSQSDLMNTIRQDADFKERQKVLYDQLGPINTDTILNRARASASAAQLLGDAGRFATGADPTAIQSGLLNRINRGIDDQEQAYLLRSQYGGFNPAAGLEGIQRMREDSDLTALTQAVQMAAALTGGLSGGSQVSQSASGQMSNASLGALGIAANQAQAANALRQQASLNNSDSMANGISGAFGGIGNGLMSAGMFNAMSNMGKPAFNPTFSTQSGYSGYSTPGTPGSIGGTPMFRFQP